MSTRPDVTSALNASKSLGITRLTFSPVSFVRYSVSGEYIVVSSTALKRGRIPNLISAEALLESKHDSTAHTITMTDASLPVLFMIPPLLLRPHRDGFSNYYANMLSLFPASIHMHSTRPFAGSFVKIQHGDDPSPKIDDPSHKVRRIRYRRYLGHAYDFLHAAYFDAVFLPVHAEGDQVQRRPRVGSCGFGVRSSEFRHFIAPNFFIPHSGFRIRHSQYLLCQPEGGKGNLGRR